MESTKTRYCLPALDEHLAKQFEQISNHIKANAEAYASRSLPPPDNTVIQSYFEEDRQKYQGLIDEVKHRIQIETRIHEVSEHKVSTANRLREVQNQQSVVKEKGHTTAAKLHGRSEPYNVKVVRLAYFATTILCLMDGIYNISVFTATGSGYIEAVLLGLFFAFVVGVVAHCLDWVLSFAKAVWQRRSVIAVLFAVMACIYTFMAIQRAAYLERQETESASTTIHYSPIPFVLISLLIFCAAVVISLRYFPTLEQHRAMAGYQKLLKEKQDNDAEQKELKAFEASIEQEHIDLRLMNASIIEYGRSMEALITSKAKEGLALFIRVNTMFRKDGARPKSFDNNSDISSAFNTNFDDV